MKNQTKINNCMKVADEMAKREKNMVKVSKHDTLEHDFLKFLCVKALVSNKDIAITECKWSYPYKGRTDVFVPSKESYVEILCSETDAMLKSKCANYPVLGQFVLRVDKILTEGDKIILHNIYQRVKEELPLEN